MTSLDPVLYVKPGSAGPRRFKLRVSAGMLLIDDACVQADVFTLSGVDSAVLNSIRTTK